MKHSRIGYPTHNITLQKNGILASRSCKMNDKVHLDVINQSRELLRKNLDDLYEIVKWNIANDIFLFRIPSDIAPHISNWRLLPKEKIMDYSILVYDLEDYTEQLKKIGNLCKTSNHRITFHPGPYTILNTTKPFVLTTVMRELYWHAKFFDIGEFPIDSTITIHGGGLYGSKHTAKLGFTKNFNALPRIVKRRIILENDEDCFNIDDIFELCYSIKPYKAFDTERRCIPICFDYFHYLCYNKNFQNNPKLYQRQCSLKIVREKLTAQKKELCKHLCPMKMHLSEQAPNLRLGAHSDYIESIPKWMLEIGIDLMLESKMKEITIFRLRNTVL